MFSSGNFHPSFHSLHFLSYLASQGAGAVISTNLGRSEKFQENVFNKNYQSLTVKKISFEIQDRAANTDLITD